MRRRSRLPVALEIEQRGQVAVVDAGARLGGDDRLGVEGDAQPGRLDHGQVIGAVADRDGLATGRCPPDAPRAP